MTCVFVSLFFFFSSRRRHTRFDCDWSSDVCSSDLDYRNEVLSGHLRLKPDARTDAAMSVRYGDARYHFPTDGSGDPVSNNQHQVDRGPSVGLELSHVFSDDVEGRVTGTWHRDNAQYAIAPNGPSDTTTVPFSSSDCERRAGLDGRPNLL